jgi:hypothetical protein
MIELIIEPLGVEVNQSNSLYALLPTNKPNCWVSLLLNHLGLRTTDQINVMNHSPQCNQAVLALVAQDIAGLGH